jgi:hypothetical protein
VKDRRSHYEMAFERFLERRGTAYVAVEALTPLAHAKTGVKAFDYIVYPSAGKPCLVDVKGRRATHAAAVGNGQLNNWVTQADIKGLLAWREVFGEEYEAVFVFSYWMTAARNADPADEEEAELAGRRYRFRLVNVEEYARFTKRRSARWGTVSIPRAAFREIARPLEVRWPVQAPA